MRLLREPVVVLQGRDAGEAHHMAIYSSIRLWLCYRDDNASHSPLARPVGCRYSAIGNPRSDVVQLSHHEISDFHRG